MNFNNSIQEASKNVKGFSTNEETILVVDDSRQLVNFLADSILASLGYRSMKAFNGKTALNIIRNHQSEICLMLLDLEMPDMTGLELLRKARAAGYDVPAIMITARGSEQIAVDAFRLGVHDYLTKPVDFEDLSEAIKRALSETRLRREKAELTMKLQEQLAWFSAISDVGQSGISNLGIDMVLARILEAGVSLTQAEQGFIALKDSSNNQLFLRAVKNIEEKKVDSVRLPVSDALIKEAFVTGHPVRRTCDTRRQSLKVSTGLLVYSLIHVPIHYHGHPLGVLSVNNNTRFDNFSRNDETLLSFLADYAAIAIVNANSMEKARREIGERKKVESELRESEERYALAVRGSNDGIWDWDLTTNQIYFSPRWKEILGYSENEIPGNANEWFSRIHKDDLEQFNLDIYNHLHNRSSHFTNEHRLRHKNGGDRWVLCRGMAFWKNGFKGGQGAVRMSGSISDITEWKAAEDRLLHDALHDPLTSLPNRVLFMDRLNQTIERSRRREEYKFAVLFLDIDNFKDINDSIGHMIGDQLLIKVGEILASGLRPVDTIARFAGDEFIILLDDIGNRNHVDRVIDRLEAQFDQVIQIEKHEIKTSVSIGIVMCDSEDTDAEDIIRNADIAMYSAKTKGKARAETYEPALRQQFLERLNLEIDLRKAIKSNEFVVHYQPILGLEDRALLGFEALVRWQHPKKGLLYPKDFIRIAEETDLIVGIDYWVLSEACRQAAAWNQRFSSGAELSISINISGRHINNPELLSYIQHVLEETGLHPWNLKLEITELSIVDQSEFTVRSLSKLREMGVQLQIDDFGIAYSSLSYLSRFPINALKIDKSFVLLIGIERSQVDIIRAIITLSDQLNVDVIAEGIETQDQLNELLGLDCRLGQGFLLSHPLDPGDVEAVLTNLSQDENGRLIWVRDED